jgi:RHS repeat-associated protein
LYTAHIQINSYLYRSYRYDSETGLYYLQSRYYSPEWGRFISQDGTMLSSGAGILGHNMYSYCANDPVNLCDPDGRDAVAAQAYLKNNPMPPIYAGPLVSNVKFDRWLAGYNTALKAPGRVYIIQLIKKLLL